MRQLYEAIRIRRYTIYLFAILISGLFYSNCSERQAPSDSDDRALFISTIFTDEGSFTAGVEGPGVNLYAVNFQRQSTIGRVTPEGVGSLFAELPDGSTGNGIRFNSRGDMLVADYTGHNVLSIDMVTRDIEIYIHESRMNQPNDLAIGNNDVLYASDPNWADSTGQIWRIDPDRSIHLLESEMGTTNGIEVSPDGKILYVNESVQRKVWAYDLSPAGEISQKRLLIQFPDHGLDGMRCDAAGNLYITRYGKGTVVIVSPEGVILREVKLPGLKPSNIAFGGRDGRTCFVTLADKGNIATFRTNRPGRSWVMSHTGQESGSR
jgi:gluconolactonase